jgi:hypothetical protein
MGVTILKVMVFSDGAVRLDGRPVSLTGLAEALDAASSQGTVVWYYRENGAADPPETAMEVMKLIADRRLPVRLSTKPDFSDAASEAQGFAAMRARAAQRQLVILRPDRRVLSLPALSRDAAPAAAVAEVEKLLPSATPRRVAAIADMSWSMEAQPNLQAAARAIPFFGLLMGFAAIGHAVWIFDGSVLEGCREADLVIVDSARLESLPGGWQRAAASVRVFDRATRELRKL